MSAATSISDLHYQLGKLVETSPGVVGIAHCPVHNSNRRHFADIEPVGFVNTGTVERLEDWAADHLASLSPERRAQLESEWNQ